MKHIVANKCVYEILLLYTEPEVDIRPFYLHHSLSYKNKLRGFGPRANYTDRAIAACWPSSANFCW
jgi:hypothetical protein